MPGFPSRHWLPRGGNGISISHPLAIPLESDRFSDDRLDRLIRKAEAACIIGNMRKAAGVVILQIRSTISE